MRNIEDEDEFLFASSEYDYLFRVAKYDAEPILQVSREILVKPKGEGSKAGDGEAAPDNGESGADDAATKGEVSPSQTPG